MIIKDRQGDKDIRQALNRRCSGYSNGEECKFSLLLDQPESRSWGEGWVKTWHKCVNQESITTRCGRVLTLERGYIMSRAYPKYYMGGESCTWHISVPPSQVLLLIVLDLQLRGLSSKGECDDSLTIDHQAVLCGEMDNQLHFIASTGRAVLRFKTATDSQYVYPQRGFLIEVIPVGCEPSQPSAGSGAYLVSHNQTHATYQCTRQHVFPPTLSPTTTLRCTGNSFHSPLPGCVHINHLLAQANVSVVNTLLSSNLTRTPPLPSPWIEDVFLPLALTISTLVLCLTALILLILIRNHLDTQFHQQEQVANQFGFLQIAFCGTQWHLTISQNGLCL